jgi:hypothetical protein
MRVDGQTSNPDKKPDEPPNSGYKIMLRYIIIISILSATHYLDLFAQEYQIGIKLEPNNFRQGKLPDKKIFDSTLAELDYNENIIPKFFLYDLNNDKHMEWIIESSPILCGTGGCDYIIIDGKTDKIICEIFGGPIYISNSTINNYPIIYTYAHTSAFSGNYSIYVYDKIGYKMISKIELIGETVYKLFEYFKDYRKLESTSKNN